MLALSGKSQQFGEKHSRFASGMLGEPSSRHSTDQPCLSLAEGIVNSRYFAILIPAYWCACGGFVSLQEYTAPDRSANYVELEIIQQIRRKFNVAFPDAKQLVQSQVGLNRAYVCPVSEITGTSLAIQRSACIHAGFEVVLRFLC